MQEIEERVRATMQKRREEEELKNHENLRARTEQNERHRKVLSETRETIRRNKLILDSTSETLQKLTEARKGVQEIDNKFKEFQEKVDRVLKDALRGFAESGVMASDQLQHMKTTYGEPKHSSIEEIASVLVKCSHIVFLTGAGISTASGVPMFKNNSEKYLVGGELLSNEDMATPGILRDHPYEFWDRYTEMIRTMNEAEPNVSHVAIQRLAQFKKSQGQTVKVVTQNIDGYHRANMDPLDLYEIHGNHNTMMCFNQCSEEEFPYVDLGGEYTEPPKCPSCSGLARPKVLLFGETYNEQHYKVESVKRVVEETDCLIVVGTQLALPLPKRLLQTVITANKPVVEINVDLEIHYGNVYSLREACERVLPRIVDLLVN